MKFDITSLDGKSAGSIDLNDEIFGLDPREDLIARMVRYQLAKRRAGTHAVKNRADIARTGKKMYKQKGTGASLGSARLMASRTKIQPPATPGTAPSTRIRPRSTSV